MQSVFVIITKLIASKIYFCKEVFCNNFGRDGKFWGVIIRGAQPSPRLSEDICLGASAKISSRVLNKSPSRLFLVGTLCLWPSGTVGGCLLLARSHCFNSCLSTFGIFWLEVSLSPAQVMDVCAETCSHGRPHRIACFCSCKGPEHMTTIFPPGYPHGCHLFRFSPRWFWGYVWAQMTLCLLPDFGGWPFESKPYAWTCPCPWPMSSGP